MSLEPDPGMRSTITDEGDGLTIVMPPRRIWPLVVFLPIWLTFWTVGGLFAPTTWF